MNTKDKTLIARLLLTAAFALPLASMADSPEEIRERVKKVGELNMAPVAAQASAPESASAAPEVTAATEAPAAAPAPAPAPANNGIAAADLYQSSCFACHGTGAAGAPIVGDKAAWDARIANGDSSLLNNALNGINAMPPRGGTSLSDDEITAVVAYMVENSQ